MADTNGKQFWADASKKVGTWTGSAAVGVLVAELAEDVGNWGSAEPLGWHHIVGVVAAAVIRAVLGLVQGNVGDRSKASFSPAPGPSVDVPASALRSPAPDSDPDDLPPDPVHS